ncbi:hypothetical protein AAG570_004298, partial [Ranatra chinensis]
QEDIESIVNQIEKEEQKKLQVVEKVITPPTRRAFSTLCAHPYKDELIMFGGEFHNGQETFVYNDLFVYKIVRDEWTLVKCPGAPPPRTAHQAITLGANKGEMWIFGGEFTTKTESQFYHYRDLWVFNIDDKKWTKVSAPGGPSARSGHRMVYIKKQLFVFGGYHDNLQDYKYFNDLYTFDMQTCVWTKLEPTGTPPSPRSGCQMVATPEGKIVIWGGYSKTKVKKGVDKGVVHSDMFLLSPDKNDMTGLKWKWSSVKPGGVKCEGRSGVSATCWGGRAYTFGGSCDVETEEDVNAEFFNELHSLDLKKLMWSEACLSGKKDGARKKRRRKERVEGEDKEETEDEEEKEEMSIDTSEQIVSQTVVDDGVFTMTIGPSQVEATASGTHSQLNVTQNPHSRINCALVVKSSKLYLYGGIFEDGDKQYTLCDFYSLDLHKLDEWKTLIPCDLDSQEWIESGEEMETESDEDDDSNEDSEDENAEQVEEDST